MTWADYGKPISADPEILGAAELVRRLYEDLGEGTGGPLHGCSTTATSTTTRCPTPMSR